MTQIKICGITSKIIYQHCADLHVDWVGLVFFEKSPRHLSYEAAEKLADLKQPHMKHVALTVNADEDMLSDIIRTAQPDMLQLHGDETAEQAEQIQQRFGIPVMPVIKISSAQDVQNTQSYMRFCDWILCDAAPPVDAAIPGGRGEAFDWQLMSGFSASSSWMLAGGLHAGNVAQAIQLTQPDAVDISSGVESSKGVKDPQLITDFVSAVRNA